MRISKFVNFFLVNNKFVLFNTINESFVEIPYNLMSKNKKLCLPQKDLEILKKEMCFYVKDNDVVENFKDDYMHNLELNITIALTQRCNLDCVYCLQRDCRSNDVMEISLLREIANYVNFCIETFGYKLIYISFFGGEPLLCQKEILYFKDLITNKLNSHVPIFFEIETNGVLLDKDFLLQFDNITIDISLSSKEDHDLKRKFKNGKGSFNLIINNIGKCTTLFQKDNFDIRLRYNSDHKNFNQIEDFVVFSRETFPFIKDIEIAFTNNFEYNSYKNEMSSEFFKNWYVDSVIEILVKNEIYVPFPIRKTSLCFGYSPHSIIVYPNGKCAQCSNIKYNEAKIDFMDFNNQIRKRKNKLNIFAIK
jgi:sulfatase maturation enzyme AslB (radical SAM superfamily)